MTATVESIRPVPNGDALPRCRTTESSVRRSVATRSFATRSPPRGKTLAKPRKAKPKLTPERVTELVDLHPIPMVLHGGTSPTEDQLTDLARGCAKVNISTALKIAFVDAHREYLEANPGEHDPPKLLAHVREAVKEMAAHHIRIFGSAGRASATASAAVWWVFS